MVTHDPRAASYADRVVFLRDGKIVHQLENDGNGVSIQLITEMMTALEL
jgi:ABC-type lipoprotein export system ATPase subunit